MNLSNRFHVSSRSGPIAYVMEMCGSIKILRGFPIVQAIALVG